MSPPIHRPPGEAGSGPLTAHRSRPTPRNLIHERLTLTATWRPHALLLLAIAACASAGTVRPPFRPLYEAFVDTVAVAPVLRDDVVSRIVAEELDEGDPPTLEMARLIVEIERLMAAEGVEIRVSSVLDGYLETRWFDVVTGRSSNSQVAHPGREILLRFWLDPIGPLGYQVTGEAVHRRIADPSLPSREREVMVPPGHEGEAMLLRILNGIRERFGG